MTSMKLRLTGDRLECKWWPALSSRPTTQDQLAGKISGPQSGEAQPHTLVRAQLAQAGANLVENTRYILNQTQLLQMPTVLNIGALCLLSRMHLQSAGSSAPSRHAVMLLPPPSTALLTSNHSNRSRNVDLVESNNTSSTMPYGDHYMPMAFQGLSLRFTSTSQWRQVRSRMGKKVRCDAYRGCTN
jgi:hypothetical protein